MIIKIVCIIYESLIKMEPVIIWLTTDYQKWKLHFFACRRRSVQSGESRFLHMIVIYYKSNKRDAFSDSRKFLESLFWLLNSLMRPHLITLFCIMKTKKMSLYQSRGLQSNFWPGHVPGYWKKSIRREKLLICLRRKLSVVASCTFGLPLRE